MDKYTRRDSGLLVPRQIVAEEEWTPRFALPGEDPHYHYFEDGLGQTKRIPRISGGINQNFAAVSGIGGLASIASEAAVTATTETALWNVAQRTPIAANDPSAGKIYEITAGGIMSWAATGTLIITPRYGLVISGVTLGANPVAQTTPGATTNSPWLLKFYLVFRAIGAPGSATSTCTGSGLFTSNGTGGANAGTQVSFGGAVATVDSSINSGIWIGWTLSVAGTITPQYVFIQSLN